MKVGVHLPQWGQEASRSGVMSVARCVEGAGYDGVWVADHVVYPTVSTSRYPYRVGGLPITAEEGFLEALTTLAVVAGCTERVTLGTSVLVLPLRETLLTAKMVATLDVLAGGRTVLAVGAGWWAEEFAALGSSFDDRGGRFDEQLAAVRALWRDGIAERHGRYLDFDEVTCRPTPVQPGGPRLLIGGTGPAAWRRAATMADGWHAVGGDLPRLRAGRAEIERLAAVAGRDPSQITVSASTGVGPSAERALERLVPLKEEGLHEVVLNFVTDTGTGQELCTAIERFSTSVLPHLR